MASGRLAELRSFVSFNNVDILCLTETWLKPKHPNSYLDIPGFQVPLRKDRVSSKGGGVAVYLRSGLSAKELPIYSPSLECIALQVTLPKRKKIVLFTVYRPPNVSMDAFLDDLDGALCRHLAPSTYIVGDFNAKHSDWFKDQVIDTSGEALKCFADSYQMHQIITEPTYNVTSERASQLDLVFTNNAASVRSHSVLAPIADHCPVQVQLSLKRSHPPKPFVVNHYLYDEALLPDLLNSLRTADWCNNITGDISLTTASWTQHFLATCKNYIPQKSIRVDLSSKPWYSTHLKYLASCRDRLFRRAKRTGLRSRSMDAYRKVRNLYVTELRASEAAYFHRLGLSLTERHTNTNCSKWLRHAKRACGWSSPRQLSTLSIDGVLVTAPEQQARVLNTHFQRQCSAFPIASLPVDSPHSVAGPFQFNDITPDQVCRVIRSLPCGKSSGLDGVTNELLKLTADEICTPLATLFTRSLREGIFPTTWKESVLTPVPKPGKDLCQPASYRPIALLSCLSKLLERLVHNQLLSYCLTNNHIPDSQFGFLRGRSAEWQLLSVLESWHRARDQGKHIHAVFLDAAKAFDRVDHTCLLRTLHHIGIDGTELQWFADYLSDRQICTRVAGVTSDHLHVSSGVPQGSVLGPLLFLLHFRSIPDITSAASALFADDTLLYKDDCRGCTAGRCCDLQQAVEQLSAWAEESGTTFNPAKSVEICVGPRPTISDLHLNNMTIPRQSQTKHLGVLINSNLRWKSHLTALLVSVTPQVTLCQRLAYHHKLSAAAIKTFYIMFIRPRLEYCSAVWSGASPGLLRGLEKVQLKVVRAMYRARQTSAYTSLLQKANLPTLAWRRREHCLIVLWKLINNQGPPQLSAALPLSASSRSARVLRSSHSLEFPCSSSSLRLSSFLCFVIPIWNALPSSVVSCTTESSFRSALRTLFSADRFCFVLM